MIRKACKEDVIIVAKLAEQLWPEHTVEDLIEEMGTYILGEQSAVFIAYQQEEVVGFAQCQLRNDYVEGTESSPVGYLEGIFVSERYRLQGIARQLLSQCQVWAKIQGCKEFASDCELTNEESLKFHLKAGFKEANRIICFAKYL